MAFGPPVHRRQRLTRRAVPLGLLAAAAFGAGTIAGTDRSSRELELTERFASAWKRGDARTIASLLTPAARERYGVRRIDRTYERAADALTLQSLHTGPPKRRGDTVRLPIRMRTRIFGTLRGTIALPFAGAGDDAAIDWRPDLVFPGLRRGERLTRTTTLPERAAIVSRDGETIAQGGTDRAAGLGPLPAELAGRVGPIPKERREEYARLGFPPDTTVGVSGLERFFDRQIAGVPGGELRAGDRVLAVREPRRGAPARASIDASVQRAANAAIGDRYGGIAAIEPRSGEVLALTGIAANAPQPPGSTFKIVTTAGVLEAGLAKPSTTFPLQTETTLSGVTLQNANEETCGGTFKAAFAESCNSVFAPLGAKLGARRLVAIAERFGFNRTPPIGAGRSSIPPADEIGDDLAVGSTAIGQGRVLATGLEMASVAATIGNGGRRAEPTLAAGEPPEARRVIEARTARTIRSFMVDVVAHGTGSAASIPGVTVAGKTGTAELRSTQGEHVQSPDGQPPPEDDEADTDAWFTSFAPAGEPRVAVSVLLIGAGAGGANAAPIARTVLEAGLKATR